MERFWEKVNKTDECWLWTAGTCKDGYGRFRLDGRVQQAHRVAYELLVGPIPEGLELDHVCRVTACVRPDHLEPVTHQENMARGHYGRRDCCKRGHLFTPENTRWVESGRRCRKCAVENTRRYQERRAG